MVKMQFTGDHLIQNIYIYIYTMQGKNLNTLFYIHVTLAILKYITFWDLNWNHSDIFQP